MSRKLRVRGAEAHTESTLGFAAGGKGHRTAPLRHQILSVSDPSGFLPSAQHPSAPLPPFADNWLQVCRAAVKIWLRYPDFLSRFCLPPAVCPTRNHHKTISDLLLFLLSPNTDYQYFYSFQFLTIPNLTCTWRK